MHPESLTTRPRGFVAGNQPGNSLTHFGLVWQLAPAQLGWTMEKNIFMTKSILESSQHFYSRSQLFFQRATAVELCSIGCHQNICIGGESNVKRIDITPINKQKYRYDQYVCEWRSHSVSDLGHSSCGMPTNFHFSTKSRFFLLN